ncbi:unnamed protein product [Didymodactylos carnosus]|uniref:EGF-like domain-containing protein n=1 Tax=Didymodactylos carnosus TaxID=1234261 RepID=A0A814NBI6_9BILA|nr:unnamed protein product [Didymodactylos carnosus]CAF1089247.1 unnamed protein product [Didymodactylos carnosus]CAF3671831.1 unnamed protein product [Didymodactylos carnosus]CAF3854774.1 unnamed protein product [Didymodactylos carnosus]
MGPCEEIFYRKNFFSNSNIDECSSDLHNCTTGQRCENLPGSYRCIRERNCGTGYQVDAVTQTCTDIDECEKDMHDCGCVPQKCPPGEHLNVFLGRCSRIQCHPGYNATAVGKCVDINECKQVPSPCKIGERCDNTIGSYRCVNIFSCAHGLEAKELQCIDIDECSIGNHTCLLPAICKNTYGSYLCQCPAGYVFKHGACVDDDECSRGSSMCPSNSYCQNTPGSFTCDCVTGYKMLEGRNVCEDVDECKANPNICEQQCINFQGSYYCLCKEGYRLNPDKRTCRDLDECALVANLCQYRCDNTPGSYQCQCPQGYNMERARYCRDIDECRMNTHNCRTEDVCINLRGGFRCYYVDCPEGYEKQSSNRCQLSSRSCYDSQNNSSRCSVNNPVKYIYSFVSLPAKMPIPVEVFRVRNGILNAYQRVEFDLRLINAKDPFTNVTKTSLDHFYLKRIAPHDATLSIVKEISPSQDIELDIRMSMFSTGRLQAISVMKLFIFVSQYEF